MTAEEKAGLARFLGLAEGWVGGGFVERREGLGFEDDPEPAVAADSCGGGNRGAPEGGDGLERIAADVLACEGCRLALGRKRAVPGEGAGRPLVMVVGEGPGAEEDASGRPFVGKAGRLLDKMLAAIGLSRESNCFIANVVKCRPPGNRDPLPDETAACSVFLERQARLLRPKFILCVGRIAAQALLDTSDPIGRLRGKIATLDIAGTAIPFLATYHPSALLRNDDLKRPAWEDLKTLRAALEDAGFPTESGGG